MTRYKGGNGGQSVGLEVGDTVQGSAVDDKMHGWH